LHHFLNDKNKTEDDKSGNCSVSNVHAFVNGFQRTWILHTIQHVEYSCPLPLLYCWLMVITLGSNNKRDIVLQLHCQCCCEPWCLRNEKTCLPDVWLEPDAKDGLHWHKAIYYNATDWFCHFTRNNLHNQKYCKVKSYPLDLDLDPGLLQCRRLTTAISNKSLSDNCQWWSSSRIRPS
jgi:hypothetical protein